MLYVIIVPFWYYSTVYMSSNDISPCLMTQRDPLKSDERYYETNLSGNRCLKNKFKSLNNLIT